MRIPITNRKKMFEFNLLFLRKKGTQKGVCKMRFAIPQDSNDMNDSGDNQEDGDGIGRVTPVHWTLDDGRRAGLSLISAK